MVVYFSLKLVNLNERESYGLFWPLLAFFVANVREGFMKKIAVLLDFVQMRGGGPCPKEICHLFVSLHFGQ